MSAIRIHKHLDSETVHLPELRSLIGKEVEIVVLECNAKDEEHYLKFQRPPWPSTCPTVEEVAREQGKTFKSIEDLLGGWPEDQLDDGFEEAVKKWREEDFEIELRRRTLKQ